MTFDPMGHVTPQSDLDILHRLCNEAVYVAEDCSFARAVEIGSWAGSSALVLCEHFDHVYCVDHWMGNPGDRLGQLAKIIGQSKAFETFCRNMGDRLYRTVIPCFGSSGQYARIWPRKVSLVFIDASHEFHDVFKDISAWREHVLPGGIICGHDWGIFEGVNKAVELSFGSNFKHEGNMWWSVVA